MIYLPGMEPDAELRAELKFCGGVLDLRQFDKIFISISGGKDSHAMLWLVKELAEKQGVADRLEAESGYTMSMSGKRIRDRIR